MENVNQWYFTKEQLASTPSRKGGIDANKELSYRQQAANFIQDMGQRLQVSQLCINTAIVYMHRFYVFHSFTDIHRNNLSVAALFLAAKVEEQPRKLEHVIKVAHACLHKDAPALDVRSEAYADKQFEVVTNESILLQTLGFVLGIEHPHTYVVKLCQMVKACKDLAQTSYFMATTSLHMTTMCLQFKPTIVAAVCIHLACKWSSWKIEPCSEGNEWYFYVDKTVTLELLESLTQEFIIILENSPHRFKKKFMPHKQEIGSHFPKNALEALDPSKHHSGENKVRKEVSSPGPSTSTLSSTFILNSQAAEKPLSVKVENSEKHHLPPQPVQHSPQGPKKLKMMSHPISIDAYREKREKERLEQKHVTVPPVIEPAVQPVVASKPPQHAFSDHDRNQKHASNSVELHLHPVKEKVSKNSVGKEPHHQVHSASVSKVNHHISKKPDSLHSKESKANLLKISSNVSSDPVVLLERVKVLEMKPKPVVSHDLGPEIPQASSSKLANAHDYNSPAPVDNVKESVAAPAVTTSPVTATKSKHHKYKTNSIRSNHNSVHPHTLKRSPDKDIKTNGSKETTDPNERRNSVVENNVTGVTKTLENSSKHEKREKSKSKHSYNSSSKEKVVNSESSIPAIKVKIRKEVISKMPEKHQSSSVREESPKKSLKIKLPKPPVPMTVPEPVKSTNPIRLVITKDKSGSGAYCASHKNERESRKRALSPGSRHEVNFKSSGETASKHAKLDHAHSSHSKQSKARHSSSRNTDHASNSVSSNKLLNLGNDSSGYHNAEVDNYASQPYYGNQHYPYQVPPLPPQQPQPPPPPPSSAPPASGYRGKTNYNHYQPPPPE